jgi:hypothetical protein
MINRELTRPRIVNFNFMISDRISEIWFLTDNF